jgi:hypothetical protein
MQLEHLNKKTKQVLLFLQKTKKNLETDGNESNNSDNDERG